MSALTSLLVRDQVVPVRKIEEALQRQVVSGGEIETVLLEMAALPENVLAGYAAATIGLRAATADEVMRAPREVVRIVPREVAEKHRLVPVAVEGRILYVAVIEALSAEVDQQLGFLLGFDLVPRVVTEVRLAAALAQHYGVEPLPRLARLAEKLKERDPGEMPYVAPLASRPAEQYLPSERRRVGFGAFDDEDEDEASESSQTSAAAPRPVVKWSTPAAKPDAERVALAGAASFGESVERATRPFGFAVPAERNTVPDRPRPSTWTGPAAAPAVPAAPPPSVPPEPALAGATDRSAVAPPEPPASIPAAAQSAATMPSLSEPPRAPSWRPSPSARPEAGGVKTLLVALGAKDGQAQARGTRALPPPLSAPPPTATAEERRASGFYARLRGPLGERAVADLLGEAETRDEVLATFFAFARQSFDYTALFVVQDDVAEGREASGPGATTEALERIAVSLEAGGLYAEVRRDGVGRVATLDGSERDRALATRLERPPSTPCAVLPLTIRRRVVLMLHGDRGGESFTLEELPELLGMMPRVSAAFERLILRRKFVHTDAGARAAPGTDRAPPRSSEPAPPRISEPAPRPASERASSSPTAESPPETIEAPIVAARTKRAMSSSLSVLGVPRSAPPPPTPKRPGALTPAPFAVPKAAPVPVLAEGVIAPLAALHEPAPADEPAPTDEAEPLPLTERRPSTPAQAAVVGVPIADDDDDVIVEMSSSDDEGDDDLDQGEEEPDTVPSDAAPASARARVDGSYSVRDAAGDVVAARPRRTSSPPGHAAPSGPPAPRSTSRVTPTASPTSSARLSKDTRPETPFSRERQSNTASRNEPSVIVDMGDNVEGTIEDLMSTPPDGESNIMPRLMRLGDAALPALVQHFPGPLWFDRRTPHARLPRGRDVSAVARALAAYRERAAPYVPSLLENKDADTRFYATLLASEIVHGTLLEALGRRVFDDDAGTRLLALDVLKRYQHLPEYASVLEAIRATARILHRDTGRRRTALRALAELRDARAVPMLITVLEDQDEGVRGEAHRTLVALTKQDFGDQRKRWELWAEKNVHRHRIEWLIEGLLHNDEPLRAAAGEELKRITQEYYGYHPGSPRRERERVHGKYLQWWESEGKNKF